MKYPSHITQSIPRTANLFGVSVVVAFVLLGLTWIGVRSGQAAPYNAGQTKEDPGFQDIWFSSDRAGANSLAWGDVDRDGDLDLAADGRVYYNNRGALDRSASWEVDASEVSHNTSVAWGDMDNDGFLDLAIGSPQGASRVYMNSNGRLDTTAVWTSQDIVPSAGYFASVAWGDVDGDGYADLAVGSELGSVRTYFNRNGMLEREAAWTAENTNEHRVTSIAWGDCDGDGDLDLAVGYRRHAPRIYVNNGGDLNAISSWRPRDVSEESTSTFSIAFGDVDADGDHDLAVGYNGSRSRVYLNNQGVFEDIASVQVGITQTTDLVVVAWGDANADGALDLAVAHDNRPVEVYLNRGGSLEESASWPLQDGQAEATDTRSLAWGDVDGDGDLDLAVGSAGAPNRVYLNQQGVLEPGTSWNARDSQEGGFTNDLVWGDVDNDGDFDLATAGYFDQNRVYLNRSYQLEPTASWWRAGSDSRTASIALGDVDNNGTVDLAVASVWAPIEVYYNQGHKMQDGHPWRSSIATTMSTGDLAWGDVSGDGNLDLAIAEYGDPISVYLNRIEALEVSPSWQSAPSDVEYTNLAWGDLDNDGDLDLAGGGLLAAVFLNLNGKLDGRPSWQADRSDLAEGSSIAWGDINDDGYLDLAVGNRRSPSVVYINRSGTLEPIASWRVDESENDYVESIALNDVDGDGDLDLTVLGQMIRLYVNHNGRLETKASWKYRLPNVNGDHLEWGDMNGDGSLDLAVGGSLPVDIGGAFRSSPYAGVLLSGRLASPFYAHESEAVVINTQTDPLKAGNREVTSLAPAPYYATGHIREGVIPISYQLFSPDGRAMRAVQGFYSLNGGGHWITATATNTVSGDLPLATLSRQVYSSFNDLTLPDTGTVMAPITVTHGQPIVDLDVWLNLTHTHASDLEIVLVPPLPFTQSIPLIQAAPSITGFVETVLDDQSSAYLTDDKAPFTGHYRPARPLSLLDGETTRGVWRLRIVDRAAGGQGTLLGWALHFNRTTPTEITGTLSLPLGAQESSSTISVPISSPVIDVDVLLSITPTLHSLRVELVSPKGTKIRLVDAQGQTRFANTRLSDQAIHRLNGNTSPYTGHFKPVDRLATLDGEDPHGLWTLRVTGAPEDVGGVIVGQWVLLLQTADGGQHVYDWDVNRSGFFGQSDNVVFRLEAYPGQGATRDGISGPFQRPFVSTQTYPFRVRGKQVRVVSATVPVSNAVVYQLPEGQSQGAKLIGAAGRPFRTAPTGFLPGRGALAEGDLLTALYPTDVISTHTPTRLYFSQDSLLPLTITGTQTQTLSLVITDTRRLADIDLLLDISHTVRSDLSATLVAPDGAETALFTTTRSLSNALIAVTFDQQVVQPLSRQNVTGTVRPATSLEPLVGRPLDGTWTLRLENRGQGASSIINGWGLALKVSDLFYTSARPIERGLEMKDVSAGGVQTQTVSPANPLMVFDLDVALEWDARNDSKYLAQLKADLRRASEFLYDWSNGQVALGRMTVYHDAKRSVFPGQGDPWSEADIRIYATNRMRPSAAQGGIVSEPFTDTLKGPRASELNVYGPGQVTMGAVWNRFGDASGNLGEDWSRTLAHELGHYLLFLDDNYLGMDDGLLVTVDECPGAMSDHYVDDHAKGYGEFNTDDPDDTAKADCPKTLSWQRTGRSDWQTIETFYPALRGPAQGKKFEGPMSLPLDLTPVQFVSPTLKTTALVAPVIDLKFEGRAATQTTNARVFLFKAGNEWIVDLGRPKLDQVAAHGAEPGDRLCTFDLILGRAGCVDDLNKDTNIRNLDKEPETWKPRISILPAGKNALEVRVEGVDSDDLHVRLFPQDFPAGPAKDLRRVAEKAYTATFTMTVPAYTGYVHVWEGPESGREHEIVTDYALGGRPAFVQDLAGGTPALSPDLAKMRANSLAKMRGSSIAKMRASSLASMRALSIAKMWASSLGKIRAYAAAMSSDGQVLLAGDELRFNDGEYVTLQAATAPEAIPSWATLVGQVYQISVSTPTIPITNASLSFGYLGGDVPAGQEEGLRIHFWNGATWEELPTRLDTGNNYASAKLKGPGRYALLTSVEIPLQPGWNLVGYPVQTSSVDVASRRIDEVLRDIAGQYSVVYGYDACAPGGAWQVYSPGAPGWVSDLVAPDFGRGYWINVTAGEPITLHLRGEFSSGEVEATKTTATTACVERPSSAAIPAPPSTFYGKVLPNAGFSPAAGQEVVARVDGVPCGEGVTRQEGADVVYAVAVEAVSSKRACGSADKLVTFRIGDRLIGSHPWTGNGLELLDLQPGYRAAGVELQAPACTKLLPNGDFELGLSWDASPVGDVTLTAGQGRRNTQGLRLSTAPGNTVSIERELTLPGDARRLKLAFAFKRANGVEFAPDLTLFANGQPKWQQKSANSVWREASVDLTPYRGQRVRLRLEARGWQPRQSSAVILDDLDVLVCR